MKSFFLITGGVSPNGVVFFLDSLASFICPGRFTWLFTDSDKSFFYIWPCSVITLASPSLRLVPRLVPFLNFLPLRVSLPTRLFIQEQVFTELEPMDFFGGMLL